MSGMQDCLEARPRIDIAECRRAHPRAIEAAVGRDEVGAEGGTDRVDRGAARQRELTRDEVGVDQSRAERHEHRPDRALAAADAAGQADPQGRSHGRVPRVRPSAASRARVPGRRTARPGRRRRGTDRTARSVLRAGPDDIFIAMPTTAPITEAASTIGRIIFQPSQAPKAASSLKSPKPMPSLPVVSLNAQVHRPEREVARDRAPDGIDERDRQAERRDHDADPKQRQRDVVGQQRRVPVDARERDQHRAERTPDDRDRLRAEVPADEAEERRGGELDEGIARRDRDLAGRAAARAARASSRPECSRTSESRGRTTGSASAGSTA